MPSVKIEIAEDGEISMDYKGFIGTDCRLREAKLKVLLDELGLNKIVEKEKRVVDSRFELEKA